MWQEPSGEELEAKEEIAQKVEQRNNERITKTGWENQGKPEIGVQEPVFKRGHFGKPD